MSRPLDEVTQPATAAADGERRVARSTARAFAAAVSALLISTLVISRSDAALEADGTISSSTASSGTIALTDDDGGRSLFDLRDLAPGRPVEQCVEVVYEGTILPVDLRMLAEAEGALGDFLSTTVETGSGGGFENCEGFESDAALFDGTLADLAAAGEVEVGTLYNTGDRLTFRVRFELEDTNDALGLTTTAGFVWEVTPA